MNDFYGRVLWVKLKNIIFAVWSADSCVSFDRCP